MTRSTADGRRPPASGGLAVGGAVINDENGVTPADMGLETVGPSCVIAAEQWPELDEADAR